MTEIFVVKNERRNKGEGNVDSFTVMGQTNYDDEYDDTEGIYCSERIVAKYVKDMTIDDGP